MQAPDEKRGEIPGDLSPGELIESLRKVRGHSASFPGELLVALGASKKPPADPDRAWDLLHKFLEEDPEKRVPAAAAAADRIAVQEHERATKTRRAARQTGPSEKASGDSPGGAEVSKSGSVPSSEDSEAFWPLSRMFASPVGSNLGDNARSHLLAACALAGEAGRAADSVLLFTNILVFSNAPSAGAAVLETMRGGLRERRVADAAQDPPAMLGIPSAYGIAGWDSTREIHSSTSTIDRAAVTVELVGVVGRARLLAGPAEPDNNLDVHHLLVAMLAPPSEDQIPPAVQEWITNAGFDLQRLRAAVVDFAEHEHPAEEAAAWTQALFPDGGVPRAERGSELRDASGFRPVLATSVQPSYGSETLEGKDSLNIRGYVNAICAVLGAKKVRPPLALGLFGDWGTGKSFFMRRMQERIDALEKVSQEEPERSPYCKRFVQVRFNAWHYVDTNLWASLVREIFERLFDKLNGPGETDKELKARLEKALREAQGLYRKTHDQLEDVRAARNRKLAELRAASERRAHQKLSMAEAMGDLAQLLRSNPDLKEKLEASADAMGVPQAAASFDALQGQAAELQGLAKRVHAMARPLLRSPWSLVIVTVPILVPVLVDWMVETDLWRDTVLVWLRSQLESSAKLFALATAAVGGFLEKGRRIVHRFEKAYQESEQARKDRETKIRANEELVIRELARREEEAGEVLAEAEQAVAKLESQIAGLEPGERLSRFVEERHRSDDYTKHLGLINLIRNDFEKLSSILAPEPPDEEEDTPSPGPEVRVLLYVDDLDRCPPEIVVQVLEAVHLLLAFPLFVVVVGVDPRWLRRCLELHYAHLLSKPDDAGQGGSGRPAASPWEYLEKIFQIPFVLDHIQKEGYQNMVQEMIAEDGGRVRPERGTGPATVSVIAKEPSGAGAEEPNLPATAANGTGPDQSSSSEEAARRSAQDKDEVSKPPRSAADPPEDRDRATNEDPVPLAPRQLDWKSWEVRDIKRFHPLFETPRAVKRFINTYRLIRALLPDDELEAFEGSEEEPGQYRTAMLMLAAFTGRPKDAGLFLRELRQAPGSERWDTFVARLADGARSQTPSEAKEIEELEGEFSTGHPDFETPSWMRLCAGLTQVSADAFLPFELSVFQHWADVVTRFSFSVRT